jgi:murein L,D-transpeptidase YcbB/YkuD
VVTPVGLILIFFVVSLGSPLPAYSQSKLPLQTAHPQLHEFTRPDGFIWLNDGQLNHHGHEAISLIRSSALHGLEPDDYHLTALLQMVAQQPIDNADEFDALLSDGLLDLIHDMAIGRIAPASADPEWHIPRDDVDPASILHQALLTPYLRNSLNALLPASSHYHQMTQALSHYRALQARGGWPQITPISGLLKPGQSHPIVPELRARLAVENVSLNSSKLSDSNSYDDYLVNSVSRFQKQHGLNVDGIVGPETLAALNMSVEQMINKIRINLERFRWLPDNLGQRYLLINLGTYQLSAVEDGEIKLNMKVIVGRETRSTPSFSSTMSHIVINPYWNVPHRLARRDLLPKQQQDPDYFFLNEFNIFLRGDDSGTLIDPYRVNWAFISASDFPFRLQQRPGEFNALGRLKFMFPNPWNIYLHDTPDKALFDEEQRNFSSGCIRVEQPLELAEFTLNRFDARESVISRIASGRNLGEKLTGNVAVYAVYFTVWPYQGDVRYSPDPYKRDQGLYKYL